MRIQWMLVFAVLIVSIKMWGGVSSGGGGKAAVKRNTQNQITGAETLDLYEQEIIYQLVPRIWKGSYKEIVDQSVSELVELTNRPEFRDIWTLIQHHIHFVPIGNDLTPVNDASEIAKPAGSKLEQLAYYSDADPILLISQEIWDHLDEKNRAAILLHEVVYRFERFYGATDSQRSRKMVAYIFSQTKLEPVYEGITRNYKHCEASEGEQLKFRFAYKATPDERMTELQFMDYDGHALYSKTTSILPISLPWHNLGQHCSGKGENISGGEIFSAIEVGNKMLTLGCEQHIHKDGQIDTKFYFLSSTGRSYLSCNPSN